MHEMDGVAKAAGLKYLLYSMSGAALAFVSMMVLSSYGSLAFQSGGGLDRGLAAGHETLLYAGFLLGFFGFGVKAAVFPFHGWLPSAGVAPTPVTALLHAVAVVNAGIFAILRLLYFGYGASFLAGSFAQNVMLAITSFTIVYGSAMALRMQHLKRRLAYSTVSNLSYMLLGAALCSGAGLTAAILHMIAHSALKIALFFCAGALLCRTEELPQGVQEYVFQYTGYGKKTPVIFTVFTVASLGLIGVPPLCGFASKWAIAEAAVGQGSALAILGCAALAVSAFLNVIYVRMTGRDAFCRHDAFARKPPQTVAFVAVQQTVRTLQTAIRVVRFEERQYAPVFLLHESTYFAVPVLRTTHVDQLVRRRMHVHAIDTAVVGGNPHLTVAVHIRRMNHVRQSLNRIDQLIFVVVVIAPSAACRVHPGAALVVFYQEEVPS